LDSVIQEVPWSEKPFIGGDFNGHIVVEVDGYNTVHGGFGYGVRNNGGISVLDFVVTYELLVVNSYFRKKEDHLVTFKSSSTKTQIDYFLIRLVNRRLCKNCTQHRLGILELSGGSLLRRMLSNYQSGLLKKEFGGR